MAKMSKRGGFPGAKGNGNGSVRTERGGAAPKGGGKTVAVQPKSGKGGRGR